MIIISPIFSFNIFFFCILRIFGKCAFFSFKALFVLRSFSLLLLNFLLVSFDSFYFLSNFNNYLIPPYSFKLMVNLSPSSWSKLADDEAAVAAAAQKHSSEIFIICADPRLNEWKTQRNIEKINGIMMKNFFFVLLHRHLDSAFSTLFCCFSFR